MRPPFSRSLVLPAALLAAGATLAVLPTASSDAATTRLCQSQTAPVDGGAYTVENNEWGSSAPECVTTDGGADFKVANSSILNAPTAPQTPSADLSVLSSTEPRTHHRARPYLFHIDACDTRHVHGPRGWIFVE